MRTPLTERQKARHARVIDATMALASEGGYEAVQMRDVAARAEVALGTLYRYFSSKDHLLVAALGQWTGDLQERLQARPPQGATPADRVMETLRRATRAMDREPTLTKAFISALASLTSEDDAALALADEVYGTIAEMVSDAMDGTAEDHRDQIRVLSHVWFASLLTWVRGWNSSKDMLDDLEIAVRLLFR